MFIYARAYRCMARALSLVLPVSDSAFEFVHSQGSRLIVLPRVTLLF